ncbi:MAG: hypothetical protein ACT4PU_07960 [Planctomycetota bacterium]
MATIFRALMTAVLLLLLVASWAGREAAHAVAASARDAPAAGGPLAMHLSLGLVVALVAALAQSLPFAYFLGTGFWVKAFVRASGAGSEWEVRHRQWMKGRVYPLLYLGPLCTLVAAITGGLAETGRLPGGVHLGAAIAAVVLAALELWLVPALMLRNSALMDALAEQHRVPAPATPEHDALVERESRTALPPLFQLSRLLIYASAQVVIVWLYLRFGTDGWRDTPMLPFGIAAVLLLSLGLGLNARHDPDHPRSPRVAWGRALAVGLAGSVVLALLP